MRAISDSLRKDLESIALAQSDDFAELAKSSGLNPSTDFVGADLRGADLSGQDLTEFDLTGADITGALTKGTKFNPDKSPAPKGNDPHPADQKNPISWTQIESARPEDDIPKKFRGLMNEIRSLGYMPEVTEYRRLVYEVTGYAGASTLFDKLFRTKRQAIPAPNWLRDFLLERYSVISNRPTKEFIDELPQAGLMKTFSEKEKLIKSAIWGEYDTRRSGELAKLSEKFGQQDEIYDFLADMAESDPSYLVRQRAIESIVADESKWDHLIDLALKVFRHDEDDRTRGSAIKKLAYLRNVQPDVWPIIYEAASDLELTYPRSEALIVLENEFGEFPEVDQVAVQLFHKSIVGPPDQGMLAAISIIGRLAKGQEDVASYFFKLFKSSQDELARYWLFAVLARNFGETEFVEEAIDVDLANERSEICREHVLKFISDSPELVEKYLDRLAYSESAHGYRQVRRVAYFAVAKSSWTDKDKVDFLIGQFRKETDETNRGMIADKLVTDFDGFSETVELFRNLNEREASDIQFNEKSQKFIRSIEK